jgi:hypothetical protein
MPRRSPIVDGLPRLTHLVALLHIYIFAYKVTWFFTVDSLD